MSLQIDSALGSVLHHPQQRSNTAEMPVIQRSVLPPLANTLWRIKATNLTGWMKATRYHASPLAHQLRRHRCSTAFYAQVIVAYDSLYTVSHRPYAPLHNSHGRCLPTRSQGPPVLGDFFFHSKRMFLYSLPFQINICLNWVAHFRKNWLNPHIGCN